MYCDGGCHRRGLCRANPREEPPNARDAAEYVTRWTSCRTFDAKEIPNAFAEYACGIREYVHAYDRAGNVAVSDGFHDETLCFSLPVAAPSQGLITVRGLTSCRRSSTTKRLCSNTPPGGSGASTRTRAPTRRSARAAATRTRARCRSSSARRTAAPRRCRSTSAARRTRRRRPSRLTAHCPQTRATSTAT